MRENDHRYLAFPVLLSTRIKVIIAIPIPIPRI